MAVVFHIATDVRQAACDAVVDDIDAGAGAGKLRIYSGSMPASANASRTGTKLAELTMSDPAFGAANSSGVATASSISDDTSADATGTAGYFDIVDSDDNVVVQGNVGTSDSALNLNSTSIVSGGNVAVTSLTITMPDGT